MSKKVTELRFQKRYNVAQYEHEEYAIVVACEGEENPVDVLAKMKGTISAAKEAEDIPWDNEEPAVVAVEKAKTGKAPKKAAPKKAKEEEEPEDEEEETAPEEEVEDSEEEAPSEPEEESEEEAEEEEAPPKKKKFRSKGAVYSRSSDLHKKLFAEALSKVMGKDFLTKNPARAKKASLKLSGVEFLDSDGKVLQPFKEEMKSLCK